MKIHKISNEINVIKMSKYNVPASMSETFMSQDISLNDYDRMNCVLNCIDEIINIFYKENTKNNDIIINIRNANKNKRTL